MSESKSDMTPRERTGFWTDVLAFHVLAWLVYAVVYQIEVLRLDRPPDYWQVVLVAAVSGSLSSVVLWLLYSRIRRWRLFSKIAVAFGASSILAIGWTLVRHLYFNYAYLHGSQAEPLVSLGSVLHSLNALLFWSALYFFYDHYRLARQNEVRSLRAESLARENQLKLLSYQLNPHFLFNVLNSIATMSLKKDSDSAHGMTVKLAEFLRYTLHSQPWRKVTLGEELDSIQRYLDIQSARFGEQLDVRRDVPVELLDRRLPNLILQPLVENAIKHTVNRGADTVRIRIRIRVRQQNGELWVEIENSMEEGAAEQIESNGAGQGLSNVRERLEAYYGEAATCHTARTSNSFTAVLCIPMDMEMPR
jgi:two-component system, LytTR family, sensor kinase